MLNLSPLPPGQRRAVEALIGEGVARTYPEAARLAGMSQGTLLTHINRVRQRHPKLYAAIRQVRLAQLAVRHELVFEAASQVAEERWLVRELVRVGRWRKFS